MSRPDYIEVETLGGTEVVLKGCVADDRAIEAEIQAKGLTAPRVTPAENFWSPHNAEHARQSGGKATVLPSITMKTATGEILMGWLASQSDMLATDWVVL